MPEHSTNYLSYEACSEWAQQKGVVSGKQWRKMHAEGTLPKDAPADPELFYKKDGAWRDWRSFLQIRTKGNQEVKWATYEEASSWCQVNNIISAKQYYNLKEKKSLNLPSSPENIYADVWPGWNEFLNTNTKNSFSTIERIIRLVLDSVFEPNAAPHRKHYLTMSDGKKYTADMMYPEVKLIVEYDGEYFHQGRAEKDKEKSEALQQDGWKVVRIREEGLDILDPIWNLRVPRHGGPKQRVSAVLDHIAHLEKDGLLSFNSIQNQTLQSLVKKLDLHSFFGQLKKFDEFVPYGEAQKWAQSQNIKSEQEWRDVAKNSPDGIPYHPDRTYKLEWKDWPTFLNNGQKAKSAPWATYEEAKAWAKSEGLKTAKGWYCHPTRPKNMPSGPEWTYRTHWKSWPDFLDTGKMSRPMKKKEKKSYLECKKWAQEENIKTQKDWRARLQKGRPNDIPASPDVFYTEWISWPDFLTTPKDTVPAAPLYASYEDSSAWAKRQGIGGVREWRSSKFQTHNFPLYPENAYTEKGQWKGWDEFLGLQKKEKQRKKLTTQERALHPFLSYKEASKWAAAQGITKSDEWRNIGDKRPLNVPANPAQYYKDEWKGFGHFLGTGKIANQNKVFATYKEASKWAQDMGITSSNQWRNVKTRPPCIPSLPEVEYKKQWQGWAPFLGLEKTIPKKRNTWWSYKKAQRWVKENGITTTTIWKKKASERPKDIPSTPDKVYLNEWKGWREFLDAPA